MMQVNLYEEGKTVFSLHQMDSRHFMLPKENVSFSSVRFDSEIEKKQKESHCYSYFRVLVAQIVKPKQAKKKRSGFNMFNSIETVQSVKNVFPNPSNIKYLIFSFLYIKII